MSVGEHLQPKQFTARMHPSELPLDASMSVVAPLPITLGHG